MNNNFNCLQLYNETFEQIFWIFDSEEEFVKMLKLYRLDEDCEINCSGMTIELVSIEGDNIIAVWYSDEDILIHELEHAKNKLLSNRGCIASYENDEIDAHMIWWLYRKIKGKL